MYKNSDVKEFKDLMHSLNNAEVLDVRTPQEIAEGKIEGAKELDFFDPQFREKVAQLDKDKDYLIYCRSGNRSGQTCQLMSTMGFKGKLVNLAGGYMAWKEEETK
jgi:rhodanese-related sulfurtransferase